MTYLRWTGVILILLIIYLSGPVPAVSVIDTAPTAISDSVKIGQLDSVIFFQEKNIPFIRPGNQAKIVWADFVSKKKTAYSIVYLHGFSASHAEGFPIHKNIAQRFGCNLYLSRLFAHGLDEPEPLLSLTTEKYIESAKEAIAIGKQLGDKVILFSTSTGSTLSLILAANDPDIAALIMYSPNIDLYDSKSFLLTKPWGLQLARAVVGDKYYRFEASPEAQKYWNTKYRIEALIVLKSMLDETMKKETFHNIHVPVFMGYYFKDENHQDDVVSIPRMLEMFEQLETPKELKQKVNFPDAGYHVIGSYYWNNNTKPIEDSTVKFLEDIVKLKPIKN
jgi:pimeloyl-ACP methyl ester carboxylesterase